MSLSEYLQPFFILEFWSFVDRQKHQRAPLDDGTYVFPTFIFSVNIPKQRVLDLSRVLSLERSCQKIKNNV